MGRGIVGELTGLFAPDVPRWACELTPTEVVVVEATKDRKHADRRASVALPPGALAGDLKAPNIVEPAVVRAAVADAFKTAGFGGSEIALVIPDEAVRVALLHVDSFPSALSEQETFLRWKLKKSIPFDVDDAALAYQSLGQNGTIDLLVTLSPRSVTRQYEELIESFGVHPGIVVPSTVAAWNLLDGMVGDTLFVKTTASAVTTSVFVARELRFYRKVPRQGLYEAVYPTFMYYQDKLEGTHLREVVFCGDDGDSEEQVSLGLKLSVSVRRLSPKLDDVYKPALGVLQL